MLRKPTSQYFKNTTDTPMGAGGITKNCLSCGNWSSTQGWKKHPNRPYLECKACADKRISNASQQGTKQS